MKVTAEKAGTQLARVLQCHRQVPRKFRASGGKDPKVNVKLLLDHKTFASLLYIGKLPLTK